MLIVWFVLGAVAMRFLPHAWNFTPVVAMLLLAGAWMKGKQLWIPLAALFASDFALNLLVYHYPLRADQYFTWAAWAVVLGLSVGLLKGKVRTGRVVGTTLASSLLFYLISNFGVWITAAMYPLTLAGLGTCYIAGLPFYRNAAVGDLLYAAAFFGLYAVMHQRELARATA